MNRRNCLVALLCACLSTAGICAAGADQPKGSIVFVDRGVPYIARFDKATEGNATAEEAALNVKKMPVFDHEGKASEIRLYSGRLATDAEGTSSLTSTESNLVVSMVQKYASSISSNAELWHNAEKEGANKEFGWTVMATSVHDGLFGPPYGYIHKGSAYILRKDTFVEAKLRTQVTKAVDHKGNAGEVRAYWGRLASDPEGTSSLDRVESGLVISLFMELGAIKQSNEFWAETAKGPELERTVTSEDTDGHIAWGYNEDGKSFILHNGTFLEAALDASVKPESADGKSTSGGAASSGRLATDAAGTTSLNTAQSALVVRLYSGEVPIWHK